jgi:hypothetical protein
VDVSVVAQVTALTMGTCGSKNNDPLFLQSKKLDQQIAKGE